MKCGHQFDLVLHEFATSVAWVRNLLSLQSCWDSTFMMVVHYYNFAAHRETGSVRSEIHCWFIGVAYIRNQCWFKMDDRAIMQLSGIDVCLLLLHQTQWHRQDLFHIQFYQPLVISFVNCLCFGCFIQSHQNKLCYFT